MIKKSSDRVELPTSQIEKAQTIKKTIVCITFGEILVHQTIVFITSGETHVHQTIVFITFGEPWFRQTL